MSPFITPLHRIMFGIIIMLGGMWVIQQAPPAQATPPPQAWLTVLCKFSDKTDEPYTIANVDSLFSTTSTTGLGTYWREASYGQFQPTFQASGWHTLPHTLEYYTAQPLEARLSSLFMDCAGMVDNADTYGGINLIFNDVFDIQAHGKPHNATLNGVNKTWAVTWFLPPLYRRPAQVAQKMGLAMGLPYSNNSDGDAINTDNPWDVMSDVFLSGCAIPPPENNCLPQHPNAYQKNRLGWLAGDRVFIYQDGMNAQISVSFLDAPPQNSDMHMVLIPAEGNTYYTVEARRNTPGSFDHVLPGTAVIIHHIDPSRPEPAWLVGGTTDANSSGSAAQWTVGETLELLDINLKFKVETSTSTGFGVSMSRINTGSPTHTPHPISGTQPPGVPTITPQASPSGTATLPPTATHTAQITPTPTVQMMELIQNGGFESYLDNNQPTYWQVKNLTKDKVKCAETGIAYNGQCAYLLKGAPNKRTKLTQEISAQNFQEGQVLTLSAYFATKNVPVGAVVKFKVVYATPGLPADKIKLVSPTGTKTYRQRSGTLTLIARPANFKLIVNYRGASGKLWIDDISVTTPATP